MGSSIPPGATNQDEFIAQGGTLSGNLCDGIGTVEIDFVDAQIGNECSGIMIIRTYTISQGIELDECDQVIHVAAPNPPATTNCPTDATVSCFEDAVIDPSQIEAETQCGLDYIVYTTQPEIEGAANCPGTMYAITYKVVDGLRSCFQLCSSFYN